MDQALAHMHMVVKDLNTLVTIQIHTIHHKVPGEGQEDLHHKT